MKVPYVDTMSGYVLQQAFNRLLRALAVFLGIQLDAVANLTALGAVDDTKNDQHGVISENIYIAWLQSRESDPEKAKIKWMKWRNLIRKPVTSTESEQFEAKYYPKLDEE